MDQSQLIAAANQLAARLDMTRPIVFIDLETTGTSPADDRIVEIAVIKIDPDGSMESWHRRLNPTIPIPLGATAIHGIRDNDVAQVPTFKISAAEIAAFVDGCDFAGFGVRRFDLPLLAAEFARVGVEFNWREAAVIDAMTIFHTEEPRHLEGAVRFYLDENFEDAHSAVSDIHVSLRILDAQLRRYGDLPADLNSLSNYCDPREPAWVDAEGKFIWQDGQIVIHFGKHKDTPLEDLVINEPGYLHWVLVNDFSPEVKSLISEALDGIYPTDPAESHGG